MAILNNLKDTLKNKFLIFAMLLIVFSLVTTKVVEAKTITSSVSFGDSTRLDYFENIFERSEYNHYLLAIDSVSSGYSSYLYYYLCLTNSKVNVTNQVNASATCEEMYVYYRNSSNEYVLEKYEDNELVVKNSVYYLGNTSLLYYVTVAIFIILTVFMLSWLLMAMLGLL